MTLLLVFLHLLVLATGCPAQAQQSNPAIKFKLRDGYLMYVSVRVNGAGPFQFLLDTGTTRTVIDPDLARQLQAPIIGDVMLAGVLHRRQDKLVQLQNVSLEWISVSGLGVIVDKLTRQKSVAPGIRGILGEDFLSRFDFLIDYKQHWIRFGDAPPAGERCRVEWMGDYRGQPTTNRLLIAVEFMEVSQKQFRLQLDTGARVPELFPSNNAIVSALPFDASMATSSGSNGTILKSNVTLKVGTTMVRDQDLVQSRRMLSLDAEGLLPASVFRRIYISHSGGFVVLNPAE